MDAGRDFAVTKRLKAFDAVLRFGTAGARPSADPCKLAAIERAVLALGGFRIGFTLGFLREVFAVIALAEHQLSAVDLGNRAADLIEKIAVMRDHDDCTAVFPEQRF